MPNTIIYDDHCPMCTFQMRLVTWLDWFGSVRLLPMSDPDAAEQAGEITREELLAQIHCLTPSGKIERGARALRRLGMRIPLLWPLSLLLWVPGVIWIAEGVYKVIARNRLVISRLFGCKTACSVLPERKPRES
jgi:predicted DCC family thiol-disulfide oxidoreductase YuxK